MTSKKVLQATGLLRELGLPKKQQNGRCALTLLALANLTEASNWSDAKQASMSIAGSKDGTGKYPGIMNFINENYSGIKTYKENSRESFRDETIKPFLQAGICERNPESPGLADNSKNNHYRLTTEALQVIRSFLTSDFENELKHFKSIAGSLVEKYAKARDLLRVPVKLSNGTEFKLAPGAHNQLQVAAIKDFGEMHAHGSVVIYLGDAEVRDRYMDKPLLNDLKIPIDVSKKLPDVILYDKERDWLYLIEAVTSVGPMSEKRIIELKEMLKDCKCGKIYVTAFPNKATFRVHMADIAWETEVWIADNASHLIHFNGDKFLGPHE